MTAATRRCIKCGREVGPDESMCATCNAAGMVPPAATQVHGTIFVSIVLGVVLLAVATSVLTGRSGPFETTVAGWEAGAGGALVVTLEVTNSGTHAGKARCQVTVRNEAGTIAHQALALSPELEPGATAEFETEVADAATSPGTVEASCH